MRSVRSQNTVKELKFVNVTVLLVVVHIMLYSSHLAEFVSMSNRSGLVASIINLRDRPVQLALCP